MAEISLARDFPLSSEADWQALVKEALKGAPLSSLGATSYDGIVIEPLYARAKDGNVIPGREPGEAWAVMQRVDLPDAEAANAQILDDLNNAASRHRARVRGSRRRLRLCPSRDGSCDRGGAQGRSSRLGRSHRARFRSALAASGRARRQLREGEGACARLRSTSASASIRSAPWPRGAWRPSLGASSRRR